MSTPTPQTPPDCFEGDPELLPPDEALTRILRGLGTVRGHQRLGLREALGRVLAEDVRSPIAVPGHRNSAMDGYAVASADLPVEGEHEFRVLGTAWAGTPYAGALESGCAVQIMTGAVMPDGADTVVMQEHTQTRGDAVVIGTGHRAGQNVREAGEDIPAGSVVLRAGHRLMPAELGLLASLGLPEVAVVRRLRVAVVSTGDELRCVGQALEPGLIYDSNRYTLYGMLSRLGVEIVDLGVIPDDRGAFRAAFSEASAVADVVLTSGGASGGDADFVRETLDELGDVGFWRVAIRPGRPLAFGRLGEAVFFGLPGNPVAVMVTFYEFVQPALRRLMGERDPRPMPAMRATCAEHLRKKPGRVEYYRAVLERDAENGLVVRPTGKTGSGLLHTMSDANCFIVLPFEGESVEPGGEVSVQPFFGLV